MNQGHTEIQNLKDNNENPTVIVHAGKINGTTAIPLPTEEEWRQDTSEDHDIGYINRILSLYQNLSARTSGARKFIDILL